MPSVPVAKWVVDALVLGALYALAGILLLGGTEASSGQCSSCVPSRAAPLDLVGAGDVAVLLRSGYFPLSSARVRSDSQTASIASMELVATAAPSRRWVSL